MMSDLQFFTGLKRVTAHLQVKQDGAGEGRVSAVFSTFGVIDSDGDVVRPSAFTEGQQVPMTWAHDWANPVGKGVIHVEADRAVFECQFFMDTVDGEQAFLKVKNMGDLQEWSWGFRVLDAEIADAPDGQAAPAQWGRGEGQVQYINRAEVFEVSPVLVGANRETETLAIKGTCPKCGAKGQDDEQETEPDAGKQAEGWREEAETLIQGALGQEIERLTVDIT